MLPRLEINRLYFLFIFLIFAAVQVLHLALVAQHAPDALWLLPDALTQAFLEAMALLLVAELFFRRGSFWGNAAVGISFIFVVVYFMDFALQRLMGIHVWYGIDFILDETLENFIEMLKASNIALVSWLLGGIAVLAIPLVGVLLYKLLQKFKPKQSTSLIRLSSLVFLPLLFVAVWDLLLLPKITPVGYEAGSRVLPWKSALVRPNLPTLMLSSPLKEGPGQEALFQEVSQIAAKGEKRPDIFLFITESLRRDYLTEEIAPHLHAFSKGCMNPRLALSAANATHDSWFSIFYGQHAFYWSDYYHSAWDHGSPLLLMLKKLGYKTHLFSSISLNYYDMDRVLLGRDRELLEECQLHLHEKTGEKAHESDEKCLKGLMAAMQDHEAGGHCFIVFFDSTHFDYSWPQEQKTLFTPVKEINFMKATYDASELEIIRNRYKNAVNYIDDLFGAFLRSLGPERADSVVIFTADHGEEFNEMGHLFHASNLSRPQTEIPLYMRLGERPAQRPALASHVDLLPTLYHYLQGEESRLSFLDGHSLLQESSPPFAISCRYNAARTPFEFLVHDGERRTVYRFKDPTQVFSCRELCMVEGDYDFSFSFTGGESR